MPDLGGRCAIRINSYFSILTSQFLILRVWPTYDELKPSDAQAFAVLQFAALDAMAVDEGAIRAAKVDDVQRVIPGLEPAMHPGDERGVEHDVNVLAAADRSARACRHAKRE